MKLKDLVENEAYVFYATDEDDGRIDSAFVGRYLRSAGSFIEVEVRSLCPVESETTTKMLSVKDGGYSAYPLPPARDPMWQDLACLLVPPEGWPQALRTHKGLPKGEAPVDIGRVTPKGVGGGGVGWVGVVLHQSRLAQPFARDAARILFHAFGWRPSV